MIRNKIYKKINTLKLQPNVVNMIIFYRYLSLIITSIVYFLGNFDHSMEKKIFIITCITVASVSINTLYTKNLESRLITGILIIIELVGNSFLLIPSGGLSSPYVWYAINTILITAIAFNNIFCWFNTAIYLINATYISYLINPKSDAFIQSLLDESNLILSFILITGIIQLLAKYGINVQKKGEKLTIANRQLQEANKKNKEAIKYIMELYETVQLFNAGDSKDNILQLIKELVQNIIKSTGVLVLLYNKSSVEISSNGLSYHVEEYIKDKADEINNLLHKSPSTEILIGETRLLLYPIRTNYRNHGILGIDILAKEIGNDYLNALEQLKFLASLSAITLEKFELETINRKLLINEEQNRIASEIHDGSLQRLFSASCYLYQLENHTLGKELKVEIDVIRNTINSVIHDVRRTIYSLSWNKEGASSFVSDIVNYVNEMKILNNVNINLSISDNEEYLNACQKKAIYRIICESIGNAIRHGRAHYIEINLEIGTFNTSIDIVDDGCGFNIETIKNSRETGLGLKNIEFLVNSLDGILNLQSKPGEGTKINIFIPNHINSRLEEEAV